MNQNKKKIRRLLITGSRGFIGSQLFRVLAEHHDHIIVASGNDAPSRINTTHIRQAGLNSFGCSELGVGDAVLHLAGRVHIFNDYSSNSLAEYRHVNVDATLNLAWKAAAANVKRFIFLSSIKVNGEETPMDHPCSENSLPNPCDPYAISKYEAEQGLWSIARKTGMEVVVIRSPLVYGPGVKANFLRLLQYLDKGIPLPLRAINNKRSFVFLDNLIDFIITCLNHPAAANQLFLVADSHDLGTPELLHLLAGYLGCHDRLFSVPPKILGLIARVCGRTAEIQRLSSSLQVDISKAKTLLGWSPPFTVADGLEKTVDWFLEQKNKGRFT